MQMIENVDWFQSSENILFLNHNNLKSSTFHQIEFQNISVHHKEVKLIHYIIISDDPLSLQLPLEMITRDTTE